MVPRSHRAGEKHLGSLRRVASRKASLPSRINSKEFQRPVARAPARTMHVLAAFATSLPLSSLTVHSTYPVVFPRWMTIASAVNFAVQTGRKKLILSSTVVNDWSGSSVLTKAIPIAASVRSHKIPPCNVPIGFACCGPLWSVATARPPAISATSKPIRSATGTLRSNARCKSGCVPETGRSPCG